MAYQKTGAKENLWHRMQDLVTKHNNYVRQGRCDADILEVYWQVKGMIDAAKIMGIYDLPKLKMLEAKMYKPFESK